MATVEAQVQALFALHGPRYRWLGTITVMLGTMSVVLASTIINVAIPTIMIEFQLAQDQVHWLATGFLAAMTVGMLLNAWCTQRFGARGAYLLAMGLFGGVHWLPVNISLLVAARVGQGLLAGLIQPLAMITIFQVFLSIVAGRPWVSMGWALSWARPLLRPLVGCWWIPCPGGRCFWWCCRPVLWAWSWQPVTCHGVKPRRTRLHSTGGADLTGVGYHGLAVGVG